MGGAVSSGRDNNELVDNLKASGYVRTRHVERVLRALDRGLYVTPSDREQAYKDLAWRNGPLHLSAPCIYGEVMEGLDLKPGLSFLNLGSGTGYLSTLAGLVLGSAGVNYGIEVHSKVVEYSNMKLGQFLDNSIALDEFDFCIPKFFCGNVLSLPPLPCQYDRVYVGAGVMPKFENYFKQLIKVGGILVMPAGDTLLQVTRTSETEWLSKQLLNVSFAALREPTHGDIVDPIKLELAPSPLAVLCRSAVRAALYRGVHARRPDLREPARRQGRARARVRRFHVPMDGELAGGDLSVMHDIAPDEGGREMDALLSLVLSLRQFAPQPRDDAADRIIIDEPDDGRHSSSSDSEFDAALFSRLRRARATHVTRQPRVMEIEESAAEQESAAAESPPGRGSGTATSDDSERDSKTSANTKDSPGDSKDSAKETASDLNNSANSKDSACHSKTSTNSKDSSCDSKNSAGSNDSPSQSKNSANTKRSSCIYKKYGECNSSSRLVKPKSTKDSVSFISSSHSDSDDNSSSELPAAVDTTGGESSGLAGDKRSSDGRRRRRTRHERTERPRLSLYYHRRESSSVSPPDPAPGAPPRDPPAPGAPPRGDHWAELHQIIGDYDTDSSGNETKRQKLDSGIGEGAASTSSAPSGSSGAPLTDSAKECRPGTKRTHSENEASSGSTRTSDSYLSSSSKSSDCSTADSTSGGSKATVEGASKPAGKLRETRTARRAARRDRSQQRRRHLSAAMRAAVQELPLPYELQKFVNLQRGF